MIKKLSHSHIDKAKWDHTITNSKTPEMYGLSWYLDCVSPNWGALVYGDYDAVLPLTIKTKQKITYIVQPPFCQKLGLFSKETLSNEQILLFVKHLKKFLSVRYSANISLTKASVQRPNFILNLHSDYNEIKTKYNSNCKRNIKKTTDLGVVTKQITTTEFIAFYSSSLHYEIPSSYLHLIESILLTAGVNNSLATYGTYEKNELCAAVAFFRGPVQYYYLMAGSNNTGKKNGAMFHLIDTFIRDYAGTSMILDFEGSEIEGVARFYKGFGAENIPYYFHEMHKFGFLKWFM